MNFHTPKASNPSSQLPSLTSFRGIAALWVVFYHYNALYLSQLDASPYTHLIEKGYLAVDMFFMLSGFVLTHVYRETFSESIAQHYKGFLLSRVARLYPLHILVLLLFVATVFTSRLMQYTVTGTFQTIPLAGPRSLTAFIANLFMLQGLLGQPIKLELSGMVDQRGIRRILAVSLHIADDLAGVHDV